MDTLLEQKLAILSQAVLIWLVSFIFHLYFFSVAWGDQLLHSILSGVIIFFTAYFLFWLNLSLEKTSNLGGLMQAALVWIVICTVIDIAAHIQINLMDFEILAYMAERGWHFFVIFPAGLLDWVIFRWKTKDNTEVHYTRFTGKSR